MGKIFSDEVILEKYVTVKLFWDSYAFSSLENIV
jgi:hypothetical protein